MDQIIIAISLFCGYESVGSFKYECQQKLLSCYFEKAKLTTNDQRALYDCFKKENEQFRWKAK